jgi:glycosyltransferase involved in cell wall biosynthesis
VRICIAYDCLFPWTVGGAERWYRNLAERLAADGHEVTYLTRVQWGAGDAPQIDGVRVVAVSRADELYGTDGNRRVGPPLRFGWGVLRHLRRHGRDYDVVHTASFPYFSVLAAAAARRRGGYRLVIDWHEVWSRQYWREYLGPVGGRVGYAVQRRCVRVRHTAFCFSRLFQARLAEEGLREPATVLEGEYAGSPEPPVAREAEPLVVFAGRHIPEKRVPAVVGAIAAARRGGLDVRGLVFGDGPERDDVLQAIDAHGLRGIVEAPGFVASDVVDDAMRRALCLLHPSSREGYGLVVVEASARGLPAIVVSGPDNAATELVEDDVNGFVAASAEPGELADLLLAVHDAGPALRASTREWFAQNAERLSLGRSLDLVARSYEAE